MIDQLLLLAQQAVPQDVPNLDSVYWVMLVSRILHVLGSIILVGGLFYVWAVVTPAAAPTDATTADQQFGGRRAAWAMWVGIATLVLLATGLWNYIQMYRMHERLAGSYHMIVGFKILGGLALFFLAALLAGRSTAAQGLRRNMRLWLGVCLILGLLTVTFGSILRTFPRTLKIDAGVAPVEIAPANSSSSNAS